MPARIQWTKERINELHAFLDRGWRHQDGTYRKGYKVAAAKQFEVSDDTILSILKKWPKPIEREPRTHELIPTSYEIFSEDPTVKKFMESKKRVKKAKDYLRIGFEAWRILNKKSPLGWTEDDFKTLWDHSDFQDLTTHSISFTNAVGLRQWMIHVGLYDAVNKPQFTTKGLKRAAGQKKTHYIGIENSLIDVINAINYPDTLMMFNIGIQCGARISSLKLIKPERIDYAGKSIHMTEPKLEHVGKGEVERDFIDATLQNLRQYIFDQEFKGNENIFPQSTEAINLDLKQAGVKAKLPFDLTSHVAMKHTFVSFACNHGVSLDTVALQAHTDPSTLMAYYAGISKQKKRHELLGEAYTEPDFGAVMTRIQETVRARYEEIKTRRRDIGKKTIKTQFKKRAFNWAAVEGIVKSPKSKPHIAKKWGEALELHKKGLSDDEIRRRMGWE
jgi:hypothetical protein